MKKILFNSILLICLFMFMWTSFLFAQKISNVPIDIDNYANTIAAALAKKPSTMRQVLLSYCNAVLNTSAKWWNVTWDNYYYSAKDSVFLYMICHNIDSNFDKIFNNKFNSEKDWYFTQSSFTGLWIVDYSQDPDFDYCSPTSTLNYCDLTYHIPRVFNMIINDLFSVQQSRIYGLTTPDFDKKSIETQIDEYARDKFNIKFCDSTDWKYPKLCKNMKTYTKASAKLLKDLNILNYNNLYDEATKPDYSSKCRSGYGTYTYNVLACGLFDSSFGMNDMYIGLVYNEFMYLSLFVKYYNYSIVSNPDLAPSTQKNDYQAGINYLQNNAYEFNREVNSSQKAISLGMKMLREIDVSFPLHVWFMMYQEDLLNLRDKSLYKIVTPFYTLYGKLRNVQTKDK